MTNEPNPAWSPAHRILFRFAALYWILYTLPQEGHTSPLMLLPFVTGWLFRITAWPLQKLTLWTGAHVFHLKDVAATFHPTGSGDTALNYVMTLAILVLAIAGTVLWSLLDRRRAEYRTFDAWLRLWLSLTLAVCLLGYGFAKIFPGQFAPPGLSRLAETYGESSPMGILWTFMGVSHGYTVFGGLAEVIPGFLLLFRRTRTVGALLAAATLANVVALNVFYDVPVKLYSTHMLLLALFLAGPDFPALLRLFFLRGPAQLRTDHVHASERRWLRRTGYALQALVVLSCVVMGVRSYSAYPQPKTWLPLYGVWRIDHPTSTVKTEPWTRLIVDSPGFFAVRLGDDHTMYLRAQADARTNTITLRQGGVLHYTLDAMNPRHATVSGTWKQGQIAFAMQRVDPPSYTLNSRGFHWVSEYPYNR